MTAAARPIAIGIVGLGKIARDEHVPAIGGSDRFTVHSTADPAPGIAGIAHHADIESMLAPDDIPEAIAICTPPPVRHRLARYALGRGRHVLLEKPPCTTVAELDELRSAAQDGGATLFCAWHSRFAPAVEPARAWLASRRIRRARIEWREDVRDWHPKQTWIWREGGFGAFDPGINALSIANVILPAPLKVEAAQLQIPSNCAMPAVVDLSLLAADGARVDATFDFLGSGPPLWTIEVATDDGSLVLSEGGARLRLADVEVPLGPRAEYPALYAHFAELITTGRSDADGSPLAIVTTALASGTRAALPALDASYGELD